MVANWSTGEDGPGADFSVDREAPWGVKPLLSTRCADRRGLGNATVTAVAVRRPADRRGRQATDHAGLSDELYLSGEAAREMVVAGAIPCKHSTRFDENLPWRLRRGAGARLCLALVRRRSAPADQPPLRFLG